MKLILCDKDGEVVAAWRGQFARHPQVEVRQGSILEVAADALVNPGNSFGFMDSGLGLRLSERFGFALEDGLRKRIREEHQGELLVGRAELLPTGGQPPYLIYAPVARTPQSLKGTLNAYLAARGAFEAVRAFHQAGRGEAIGSIVFPGLCTGPGEMHPVISARQLRYAFEEAAGLRKLPDQNLSRLARRERKLKELPQARDDEE